MNDLEERRVVRKLVKEAWKNWCPHFEILTSGTGKKIMAFFLLADTDVEWKLYHSIPEEFMKDFVDYMDAVKNKLLELVGFEMQFEDMPETEQTAAEFSANLLERMNEYEKRTGIWLSDKLFQQVWFAISSENGLTVKTGTTNSLVGALPL